MIFPSGYAFLSTDEIYKNNGKIIEYCFYKYFRTKNAQYIYDLLNFIKNNACLSWEDIAVSEDMELQIRLFLFSRYTMALFSFFINIINDAKIKRLINDSDILDKKMKSYIIKRYYLNIMNDSANTLKNYFLKNNQNNNSKIIIWGFKDRIKNFKSLFKFISLNKDVFFMLRYFGVNIHNPITVNGKKYAGIKKSWIKTLIKGNNYSIEQDELYMNITFNKQKNVAKVSWQRVYGFLAGYGSTTEFTKKNKWRISHEDGYWIS